MNETAKNEADQDERNVKKTKRWIALGFKPPCPACGEKLKIGREQKGKSVGHGFEFKCSNSECSLNKPDFVAAGFLTIIGWTIQSRIVQIILSVTLVGLIAFVTDIIELKDKGNSSSGYARQSIQPDNSLTEKKRQAPTQLQEDVDKSESDQGNAVINALVTVLESYGEIEKQENDVVNFEIIKRYEHPFPFGTKEFTVRVSSRLPDVVVSGYGLRLSKDDGAQPLLQVIQPEPEEGAMLYRFPECQRGDYIAFVIRADSTSNTQTSLRELVKFEVE